MEGSHPQFPLICCDFPPCWLVYSIWIFLFEVKSTVELPSNGDTAKVGGFIINHYQPSLTTAVHLQWLTIHYYSGDPTAVVNLLFVNLLFTLTTASCIIHRCLFPIHEYEPVVDSW